MIVSITRGGLQKATFGAGCFWHVEAEFRKVRGVGATVVGYMGGMLKNPTYVEVFTDTTGHAEVVQVEYDPSIVSYDGLLCVFWQIHDPTLMNRQGPDIGTQYRSVIVYHTEDQHRRALASLTEEQKKYTRKIVTQIVPTSPFYRAEEYHQRYVEKHGGSCRL